MTQTLHTTDRGLENAMIDELTWTPSVDSTQVGVAVNDGAVTPSGETGTYPEKSLALEAAFRVRGVTLEGTVHSWSESRAAARAAWSAPGVTGVVNHLHVSS